LGSEFWEVMLSFGMSSLLADSEIVIIVLKTNSLFLFVFLYANKTFSNVKKSEQS